jgi:uncharacterized OB-fold protein
MTGYATINVDADTQPFWDAVNERRLVIPRCDGCGQWVWLPSPVCPACRSEDMSWIDAPCEGTVMSWIVVHRPVVPVFEAVTPFIVLLVEVLPGVRLLGQLVDDDGTILTTDGTDVSLTFGAAVSLRWCELDGQLIPTWTLSRSDSTDGPQDAGSSRSDQPGAEPA